MKRRLINFRGTRDFAYVRIGGRIPSSDIPKKPSTTWASCYKSDEIIEGEQIVFPKYVEHIDPITGLPYPLKKPVFVDYTIPCSEIQKKYEEMSFERFQQWYAAYLAGRIPSPINLPQIEKL